VKQLKKISILLVVLTITFFGGLNKVKAEIKCYYELPFIGVKGDRYYSFSGTTYCSKTDIDSQNCKMEGQISSNPVHISANDSGGGVSFDSVIANFYSYVYSLGNDYHTTPRFLYGANEDGLSCTYGSNRVYDYTLGYTENIWCNKNNPSTALIDSASSSENMYLKPNAGTCPKYLIIRKPNDDSIKYFRQTILHNFNKNCSDLDNEISMRCDDSWYKNYTYYNPGGDGKLSDLSNDYFKAYQTSNDDNQYINYLKNFYNQPTKNIGTDQFRLKDGIYFWDLAYHDKMILPLYASDGDITDKDAEDSKIENVMGLFRDNVMTKWIDIDEKYLNKMKSSCSEKSWYNYINLKNYKSFFSDGGSKSEKFVNYATGDYKESDLLTYDKSIGKTCWNSRKDFLNYYKTLKILFYSIGINTNSDDNDSLLQNNKYLSSFKTENKNFTNDNIVFKYDDLLCSFKFVRYGFDKEWDKCSTNSELTKKKQEDVKSVVKTSYLKGLYSDDRCAYKCFANTVEWLEQNKTESALKNQYNSCSSISGNEYSKCTKAMNECGLTPHKKSDYCKNTNGSAKSACESGYDTIIKGIEFKNCVNGKVSNWSTDSETAIEDATNAYNNAVERATVTDTHTYDSVGLPDLDFGFKPYTPKCRDVKFLTIIWNVMIIAAPFLLIIYSSFDYFKVVMAGDEEKMKVAKKKVPKRLIALILLLVFPAILRAFVTKFGTNHANSTKYIRCVVNNDYGEDEIEEEEETKTEEEQ